MVHKIFLGFLLTVIFTMASAQSIEPKILSYYQAMAKKNSPLIQDYKNRVAASDYELQRLKAFYKRSKVELTGSYLFVPIVSTDDGKTSFRWDAQSGDKYYGYDLGQSSGNLKGGVTWTKPLLGNSRYKVASALTEVEKSINQNNIRLEEHDLQRLVTDQYILCLLDKQQIVFADSMEILLNSQFVITEKLAKKGLVKQSDLRLIKIEASSNRETKITYRQSYRSHLMDLNILCGIKDTTVVDVAEIVPKINPSSSLSSSYLEKFKLDSLAAIMHLKDFEVQYKPQLNLFIDAGVKTSYLYAIPKHFGLSTGITFSWLLFDGRQRKRMQQHSQTVLNTASFYKKNFITKNELRKSKYLTELQAYSERERLLRKQQDEYNLLLSDYRQEIRQGQISILDYITVIKSRMQSEKDYLLLKTNRFLLINAYNYWNW